MTLPRDPKVRLEDVADVEAFAEWQADRTFSQHGHMTQLQREEAQRQAVLLIFELHDRWEPKLCPRFSAFLLSNLSKKLISWWRVELRQSGRGSWSGSAAAYTYFGTVSLDDQPADADSDTNPDRSLTVAGPDE
jgi:hypothetical protein